MERVYIPMLLAFFIVLMACGNVWAQATAQISGAVQDQSGQCCPAWKSRLRKRRQGFGGRR